MTFSLETHHIEAHLQHLAAKDSHVRNAIDLVGMPQKRQNPTGFNTLLRVIVSQQLSVKAAATIWGRVCDTAGENPTPQSYAQMSDDDLRTAGLSKQKVTYFRSLCDMVINGTLDIEALPDMEDENAIAAITSVKGLGVWSAHMYLMFSLGRTDVWPVGDLAVRAGIGRIIGQAERPTEKSLEAIGERWRPYRSSMALLAWHYYSNAPF